MTVRTWFTISAVVVVALAGAVAYQFLRPLEAPEVLVSVGDIRLEGRVEEACWPQRDGKLDCTGSDDDTKPRTIAGEGRFRIVVAYPAQPEDGEITLSRGRRTIRQIDKWDREFGYDLRPGNYTLDVQARYPADASLHYVFFFRVTRPGS